MEAKVVDLLQGQEGFRWKVTSVGEVNAITKITIQLFTILTFTDNSLKAVISHSTVALLLSLLSFCPFLRNIIPFNASRQTNTV